MTTAYVIKCFLPFDPCSCHDIIKKLSTIKSRHWIEKAGTSVLTLIDNSSRLDRFEFECGKVLIGFALSTPHDWLKNLTPIFHPITRRDSLACIFMHASCFLFLQLLMLFFFPSLLFFFIIVHATNSIKLYS